MTRIITKCLERLRAKKTALSAVLAMGIKGVGALLTIVIFTIAARTMSADAFGQLAVWFNAMLFLSVAACFGQDTLIARSWGEYAGRGDAATAHGAYWFGWRMIACSAVVFVVGVIGLGPMVADHIASTALLAAALFLFAQTALHYSSHSSRVIVGFAVSESGRELIWRMVLLVVVIYAALRQNLSPAQFFIAGAVGMALSVLFQSLEVRKKFLAERIAATRDDERAEWRKRGLAMWLSAIVEAASAYADVMLIGYFATPAEAGDYFIAARIANIFLMVQSGLSTYSFTHSASLYFSGQIDRLQEILRTLVAVAFSVGAPCVLLIFAFGHHILALFGERYVAAYPTLIVLASAAFAMSLCGSSSVILLTTGHERLYSRVATLATGARMALTALLAWRYGAFGAACGWALVNAPLAMWLAHICYRSCGVDPSAASLMALLTGGKRRPAPVFEQ